MHFSVSEEFQKMPAPLSVPVLPVSSTWAPLAWKGLKNVPKPFLSDREHLLPCLSGCVAEKKPEHTRATQLFGEKLLETPGNFLLASMKPYLGMTGQKSSELP